MKCVSRACQSDRRAKTFVPGVPQGSFTQPNRGSMMIHSKITGRCLFFAAILLFRSRTVAPASSSSPQGDPPSRRSTRPTPSSLSPVPATTKFFRRRSTRGKRAGRTVYYGVAENSQAISDVYLVRVVLDRGGLVWQNRGKTSWQNIFVAGQDLVKRNTCDRHVFSR